jgi:outer membrane receptor protein involved in Fe transport
MFSLYAQDRWAPTGRLTITAGVRFGYQRPSFESGKRAPVLADLFEARTTPEQILFSRTNYAPRLGVSYDLSGTGRTAVKAFYGRYYAIYANAFNTANPGGVNGLQYKFLDQNGNRLYDGVQELGTLVSSQGASTKVDPNLEQPYADEISGSLEHQFWGESSARVVFVHKTTSHVFGLVNTARIGTVTVPYTTTVGTPTGPQVVNLLDIPASLKGVVTNEFTNIPGSDATYDTLSLSAQKRFAKGVFIQGGLDYQWRDEWRQPNSLSTSPGNTDPIGVYSFGGTFPTDYSADVSNRQKNTNWQARVLGRYPLPAAFSVGVNFRVQSGFPWAPVASVKLPNAGTQAILLDDIRNRRSDAVPIFDVRVDRSIKIGGTTAMAMLDVYNLLNDNAVTNFFLSSGGTYNNVIAALNPRTLQIGLRLTF